MEILVTIYGVLKIVALVISSILLMVAVYAYLEHQDFKKREKKHFNEMFTMPKQQADKRSRFSGVEKHMQSEYANDWKIAILEADVMFDEVLKLKGFKGATMGDRMKAVARGDQPYIDAVWSAHRLRNRIAHEGSDYVLAKYDADEAIDAYRRAFKHWHFL